jgi:hypothetical protein
MQFLLMALGKKRLQRQKGNVNHSRGRTLKTADTAGHANSSAGHRGNLRPLKTPPSGFLDKVLLVGVAVLICLIGVAAFVLGETYHVSPSWLFFAWGSIGMVPLFVRNFRGQLKRPAFILFLAGWVVVHGLIVASLIHWVSLIFWLPVFGLEFLVGYLAAFWLFGAVPSDKI